MKKQKLFIVPVILLSLLGIANPSIGWDTSGGFPPSGTTSLFLRGDRTWQLINTATNITGIVAVANGGSGTSTATGSGSNVLQTSPTLITPTLGTATATTINNVTLTQPATGSTLTILNGKTLTANNILTLAGTDNTTLTFQGTDTYVGRATTDTLTNKTYDTAGTGNVLKINGTQISAVTGSGNAVLASSPTLTTPTFTTNMTISNTAGGSTGNLMTATGNQTGDSISEFINNAAGGHDWWLSATANGESAFGGGAALGIYDNTVGTWRAGIARNGYFGIGNLGTVTAQLHTTGTVRFASLGAGAVQSDANGNLSISSDERLKDIQGFYTTSLASILRINPILYKWKIFTGFDTANVYAGFSAQNVLKSIPEAIGIDAHGSYTLSDRVIIAVLVNSIKELQSEIDILKNKVGLTINTYSMSDADANKAILIKKDLKLEEALPISR